MKIVIAGAGAVGFNLARELSEDKHDIIVIEPDLAVHGQKRRAAVLIARGIGLDGRIGPKFLQGLRIGLRATPVHEHNLLFRSWVHIALRFLCCVYLRPPGRACWCC